MKKYKIGDEVIYKYSETNYRNIRCPVCKGYKKLKRLDINKTTVECGKCNRDGRVSQCYTRTSYRTGPITAIKTITRDRHNLNTIQYEVDGYWKDPEDISKPKKKGK